MAKKKATMTLKDFHGGSIPSDLPLPSAPGVNVRPSDRVGFDRQTPWGNPMGRPDHRLRPGSAGTARNFDDKTPFLTPSARIGQNFDEDERKPLDGGSAPRRAVSDDSIRALPVRVEPKMDYSSPERGSGRPVTTPVSNLSGGTASSYAARFAEVVHVSEGRPLGLNHQSIGGNNGLAVGGSYPNAWGLRKEVVGVAEPVPTSWSAPDAATKLAHASALEKVSSGRWHSKQPIHHHVDVEVIRHPETESGAYSKGNSLYNKSTHDAIDLRGGREFNDATLVRHAERSLAVDVGIQVGGKELPVYERAAMSPIYSETKERKPQVYVDEAQLPRNAGKFVGSELQSPVLSESLARPKLKLLPRSKPAENVESYDYKQGYQQPSDPRLMDNSIETNENAYPAKPTLAGSDIVNRAVERPKLSLKPRSQHHEQLEGNTERERNSSLFGGARPRELVLKERGIDDVALSNQNLGQSPNKVKPEVPWTETLPVRATPTHHNEKAENTPLDHRIGRNTDRRDHKSNNTEKSDVQRRNWQNENRRNSREPEKHHRHHQQPLQPQPERPRSPETWRKPVEQPPSHDAAGPRYRKAASAVELAQAFSRSISDPKTADRFSGQRGVPGRVEVPFSRLTGPQPRPQINGY